MLDDLLVLVRACLDALPNAREVRLDYTQLVEGEMCGPDEELCANARRVQTLVRNALEPIVLLTEGRTDTRFLRASLTALYPHLEDFFTFFDFEESGSSGGTDALARMVRAFVGARVPVRIVALFDNDAAGHAGLKALDGLALPPNVKVLPFPDIEVARTHPTVGPQGESVTDVNGRACGIELYLGRAALTGLEGRLRPVVWTSYDYKSARYQGEVRGKAEVGEAFLRGLAAYQTPQAARDALPELCALWRTVFRVFDRD